MEKRLNSLVSLKWLSQKGRNFNQKDVRIVCIWVEESRSHFCNFLFIRLSVEFMFFTRNNVKSSGKSKHTSDGAGGVAVPRGQVWRFEIVPREWKIASQEKGKELLVREGILTFKSVSAVMWCSPPLYFGLQNDLQRGKWPDWLNCWKVVMGRCDRKTKWGMIAVEVAECLLMW